MTSDMDKPDALDAVIRQLQTMDVPEHPAPRWKPSSIPSRNGKPSATRRGTQADAEYVTNWKAVGAFIAIAAATVVSGFVMWPRGAADWSWHGDDVEVDAPKAAAVEAPSRPDEPPELVTPLELMQPLKRPSPTRYVPRKRRPLEPPLELVEVQQPESWPSQDGTAPDEARPETRHDSELWRLHAHDLAAHAMERSRVV